MSLVKQNHAASSGFDYSALAGEDQAVIHDAVQHIRGMQKLAILTVGQHLLRAKEVLPHGTFTAWAETELGMSDRTAQNYMRAAQFLEGKPESISALPPTIIYNLAARTASVEVVERVVAAARAGAPFGAADVKKELDSARFEAAELCKIQRRRPDQSLDELRAARAKQQAQAAKRDARDRAQAERERGEEEARFRSVIATVVGSLSPEQATFLRTEIAGDYAAQSAFVRALQQALA